MDDMDDMDKKHGIIKASDLMEMIIAEQEGWENDPFPRIGHVYCDRKNKVILIETNETEYPNYEYEIDLDRCGSNKEILEWLMEVNDKMWATPEIMKNLIDMFEKIIPESVFRRNI